MSIVSAPSRVSYAPHPHFLLSKMRENLPWWKALGELIDNAFDHGATRVVITSSPKAIEIQDDGTGIKSLVSALSLGDHQPSEHTALGMYGVGLKDAWLSVGDVIEVVSVHKGIESSVTLSVRDFLPPDWNAPAPATKEAVTGSGTTIRLHLRPGKHKPTSDAWASIAWAFTPAIKRGRQIIKREGKKKTLLEPIDMPPLTERITTEFEVEGKHVAIDIGITADGTRMERGPFWIQYGHRNITPSSIGAASYSTERLAGVIALGKGWALTKNKDDLSDLSNALADAIEQKITPLLLKAQALTDQIEIDELNFDIESSLNDMLAATKRESRNQSGESTGTRLPVGTGRRRRKASKTTDNDGSVVDQSPKFRKGIRFGWNALPSYLVGEYDAPAKRVNLNSEHPTAAALRAKGDRFALRMLAVVVLCHYAATHRDGNLTCFEVVDFNECFGLWLKRLKVEDEQRK